jgi:hypothetical protein
MTTRYGRTIKKPTAVYVPELVHLEDDYSEDEYDSEVGSLKDFVVSDSEEQSDSESESA